MSQTDELNDRLSMLKGEIFTMAETLADRILEEGATPRVRGMALALKSRIKDAEALFGKVVEASVVDDVFGQD